VRPDQDADACKVLTIGHSTRPIEDFVTLLAAHGVTQLVDVRTVPRSRHNPQFNADALPASLESAGIGYVHAPGLGGFRPTSADSPNDGWRNLSFRGYADYMQGADFADNLFALIELAQGDRVVLMCAEAVPWRLPPFADRRCLAGPRRRELRDRQREAFAGASADAIRQGSRRGDHLPGRRLLLLMAPEKAGASRG
jgi:uncharacterized protein (DUF488 family)